MSHFVNNLKITPNSYPFFPTWLVPKDKTVEKPKKKKKEPNCNKAFNLFLKAENRLNALL